MTENCIYQLIANHAKTHPDAVAITAEDRTLTYLDVMECAEAVCSQLLSSGLRTEDTVAVLMSRKADLVGILLGIWKAGGAYVPIDPDEQVERAKRMIAISRCTHLVGDKALFEPILRDEEISKLQFFDVAHIPAGSSEWEAVSDRSQPDGLAYLLFTSGSTGEPKAVEVEHQSALNLLQASRELLSVTPADKYLAATTISFDISVVELFLPLIVGGSLVLRDKSILLDPAGLAEAIRETGITMLQTGPSVWSVVLNTIPDFPHLRVAISTGEAISPEIAGRLAQVADHVWNLYGPTETTVWATGFEITRHSDNLTGASVPIGFSLAGVDAIVVGEDLQTVPVGQRGELLIGGVCVARGYRDREALTQEKFIKIGEERFYRTGDVVSCDADGLFEYFGRIDDQMKIRGIRIEPGEIEDAVRSDPRVEEVAVTWFETGSESRSIVAAVVLKADQNCSPQDLYNSLKEKIPAELIPAKFLFVPWLPINKNGKVDRKSIRSAVESTKPEAEEKNAAPKKAIETEVELTIARVWKKMLKLEEIQTDTHFFAMGGDSLAAVTMTDEIEALLGVRLPTQLALENPVFCDFAGRIEKIKSGDSSSDDPKFVFPMVEKPGSRPVFFCGGNLTLVQNWNIPCSLYFIAYWAEEGEFVEGDTIEEVAYNCLQGMREFQSEGPYRIAGYSFGGVLAFEIAQQLSHLGEEVEFLFLLDPYLPYIRKKSEIGDLFFSQIIKMPGSAKLANWVKHLNNRYSNLTSLVARWKWQVYWLEAKKKLTRYKPKEYSGQTFAVFSETQGGQDIWSRLLTKTTPFKTVKAEHSQLFQSPEKELWLPLLETQIEEANDSVTDS